jgi:hypothetical protein
MSDLEARVAALEAKLQEVDAIANLALRLLAIEKPISSLLLRFGATAAQEMAVHALLDDIASRIGKGGLYAPSFSGFASDLFRCFPAVRNNREFVVLLLDTLRLDRPSYQAVQIYATEQGWPHWP